MWDKEFITENVWLSVADLKNTEDKYVSDSKERISEEGKLLCKPVKKGTLLVSFKLTLGRLAIAGRELYTNEAIAALSIIDEKIISREYLYYYLHYFDWDSAAVGKEKVKGKTLNKAILKTLEIRFPSLNEQQRIVSILDEAFENISNTTKQVENSISNLQEMYNSALGLMFVPKNDWFETTIGDLIQKYGGEIKTGPFGTQLKASEYTETGVPVISVREIRVGKIILHDRTPRVNETVTDRIPEYLLKEGDVVFARKGGVERSAIVSKEQSGWFLGSDGIRLRLPPHIDCKFLEYFFQTSKHKAWMVSRATGSTMPSLNQRIIANIPIAICSLSEQKSITKTAMKLQEKTNLIILNHKNKLKNYEQLKQSILQEAFNGTLRISEGLAGQS